METRSLTTYIKELLDSIEDYVIQQPSMSHVIHSLKEFRALNANEFYWLKKLLQDQLTTDDLNKLSKIGQSFQQTYRLSLHDAFELIEITQDYCLTNLDCNEIKISAKQLITRIKQIKDKLAQGYFHATVTDFINHFKSEYAINDEALQLHKNWLFKLKAHFLEPQQAPLPEIEHSLCDFAKWLNTLEAKLTLHASHDHAFDLHGNILLMHRDVHEEARFIHIHLRQHDYLRALSHFERFSQVFLLLDKYIKDAQFNYLANRYQNFIDFVVSENKHKKQLDYYLVIHYGLIHQAEFYYQHKKNVFKRFCQLFIARLKLEQLDFISLLHHNRLHVVVSEQDLIEFNRTQPIYDALQELEKEFGQIDSRSIYVNLFKLDQLPNCDFEHFNYLLAKMVKDECNQHVCELNSAQIEQYRLEVFEDLKVLEVVQKHLQNRNFELHYQPIVSQNNECKTVEALLRLPFNESHLSAGEFLPIVESHHLTLEIDELVFDLLSQEIPKLAKVTPMLNVNIYPKSLMHPHFIQKIIELNRMCKHHQIQLVVEITEHEALLKNEVMHELHHKHQILFAIDDFGSGYSNLAKLTDLALSHTIQQAKLDGSLIKDIATDKSKLSMVRFITDMAANLGLQPVIVEFVDSEEKLDLLNQLPSEMIYQGYYFSKPLPIDKLIEYYPCPK